MTEPRPSKTGAELLALMHEHGIKPRLRMLPGSTIELPPPHQAAWEAAHSGKPVLASVMTALVSRGLAVGVEGEQFSMRWTWWELTDKGQQYAINDMAAVSAS